ncbi:MAG: ABC transporter permease [Geobacteraceae bacterium]|nr:ABC transporter permease [Geobacteraceae bacterium]
MLGQAFVNLLPLLRHGNAAVRQVLFRQVYFTGLEASGIIVTIAALLGSIVIAQAISLVGSNNAALAGRILVWVVLRELAPLLTALIVIARSGTAVAAELGSMKINGEIESIEMLGIPVDRYLLLPRIAGISLSVVVLTVYFVICACVAGFVVASIGWHVPYDEFANGILSALGVKEAVALFGKSLIFGLVISATCCCFGMNVGRSVTEIPQAATKAVMNSLILVFVIDGVITSLTSLLFS